MPILVFACVAFGFWLRLVLMFLGKEPLWREGGAARCGGVREGSWERGGEGLQQYCTLRLSWLWTLKSYFCYRRRTSSIGVSCSVGEAGAWWPCRVLIWSSAVSVLEESAPSSLGLLLSTGVAFFS